MKRKLIYCAVFMLLIGNIYGQKKSVPKQDNEVATETWLPSPDEIFNSINRIGKVKWSSLVSYNTKSNYSGKYVQSLNLGIRMADAFIAIHDEDKVKFGEMNVCIYNLSKDLGYNQIISDVNSEIKKLVAAEEWNKVRQKLNDANAETIAKIEKMGDSDILTAIGIGGFFEGIYITSGYFISNYDVKKVDIMKQQWLVEYYIKTIETNGKMKSDTLISLSYNNLKKIRTILKKDKLTLNDVNNLHKISKTVVETIVK